MRTNANIKSKKELAKRLIDGEVFYWGSYKICFDEKQIIPFRLDDKVLLELWEIFEQFEIDQNWYDNIPVGGVLCWVSNNNIRYRTKACRVVGFKKGLTQPFIDSVVGSWTYATPVKPEECLAVDSVRD